MTTDFDFISMSDKPALIALSNPELINAAKEALNELGYKVHSIDSHEEFGTRFTEVQYQVFIIDELFGGEGTNLTLHTIQQMPMPQRRHALVILLGSSFETLNAMQAFQQSVHAVVNYSELALLPQLIQKAVTENALFLQTYTETAKRVAQTRFAT
jgi:CheY-like chemotaxis protein